MSVTAGWVSLGETVLATGARDYETILWDIEDQKFTSRSRIDRNMVTDMKWLPTDMNTFAQWSEDRTLRLYDIREGLEVASEIKVGENFASSCDIDASGTYIVTGHRGFNNSGWFVKLWDIRKISSGGGTDPVFQNEHSFSVVSARFLNWPERSRGSTNVISASTDKSIKITTLEGEQKSLTTANDSYTAMTPLPIS
jgi:WD40 repeat protein